ncbi:hypothetical protein [Chitinimonas lacunae]|uniref:Uncharacterized protein n=1 Tax=Chitinimonas lacunae TaxID=1963018 RepID=A0ABV8MYC0_9NEIS
MPYTTCIVANDTAAHLAALSTADTLETDTDAKLADMWLDALADDELFDDWLSNHFSDEIQTQFRRLARASTPQAIANAQAELEALFKRDMRDEAERRVLSSYDR